MKIISDYINKKTEIMNEAVQERHILKFIKQLSSMGYNLTDVFGDSPNFKISDMDGTRVKEYNYVDQSVLNDVKKKIKNGGYMFWGILDDKVTIISLDSYYLIFVPVEKKNPEDSLDRMKRKNPLYYYEYGRQSESARLSAKIDAFSKCDAIWEFKLNESDKNLYNLRNDRKKSQEDVWDNSPEFYAKWLEKNKQRYIAALASLKISKYDMSKVTKRLSSISNDICNILLDLNTNMNIYADNFPYTYGCQKLTLLIQDAFKKINDLIEIQKDINSETGRRYYDIEKKSVEFDKKLVALLELLEKTEKAIKEVEDLKKDILKKQNA